MTAEETTALSTSLSTAGSSVLSNFIAVVPAIAGIVGISFVIYFVTKQLKYLKRAK